MITSMFKLISVTNRALAREPFLARVERVAQGGADAVILREKDLSPEAYRTLAREVLPRCARYGVPCILHTYAEIARELGVQTVHLPLPALRDLTVEQRAWFETLGASCHSVEDVEEAEQLGCTYVTLGHIFATECKPGLPPRGLELLQKACAMSRIPVYAIGGIQQENLAAVQETGAAGACIMSGLMHCQDPAAALQALRNSL